jgi:hypothetical protein
MADCVSRYLGSTLSHEWAIWRLKLDGIGELAPPDCALDRAVQVQCRSPSLYPKQQHRVTNWPEYDTALCQRGNLTVWFFEEAIAARQAEPARHKVDKPPIRPSRSGQS